MTIAYNGYTFGEYSHVSFSAEMVEDNAQRTVLYHRGKLRVQTVIAAESGDAYVGYHFRRIRQLLSKAGQQLDINHEGFGPPLSINSSSSGVYDVCFGPKPRFISWEPVGNTNAVEVIWECEYCLPICDGQSGVRYEGLSALNYGISYRIDKFGYTTRTVSGYLEIAMTRAGYSIPDTADAYREVIEVPKPIDYERESSWQLSPDKRRADFVITDSQIKSHNAYPVGVVSIRANHRVGWSRRNSAILVNSINATIELAHNQSRGRAWDIFRNLVSQRTQVALDLGDYVMLESLEADEELYGHAISFSLSYRIISEYSGALSKFLTSSGLFKHVGTGVVESDWGHWSDSLASIQSTRGLSQLEHSASEDAIVDLCVDAVPPQVPIPYIVPSNPPTVFASLCNAKPPPDKSYVRFEAAITSIEDVPATMQITVGGDDLEPIEFDPADPSSGNGDTDASKNIVRFIEEAPAGLRFQWTGYAERLGYDIPKPGKLEFGGKTLRRIGKAKFRRKYLGKFFCQPLYGAAWNMMYVVDERPTEVPTDESDPYNTQ